MGKTIFLVALRNIEIDEPLGAGLQVAPGLHITNKFQIIRDDLSVGFRENIGAIEYACLEEPKALLYTAGSVDSLDTDSRVHGALILFLAIAKNFSHSLWMVKDSAVNTELGFAQTFINGQEMTQSNFFALRNSTARGLVPTLKFSRHELRRAIALANDFLLPLSSETGGGPLEGFVARFALPKVGSKQSLSRLTRALYFLSGARASSDLGVKIVHYCTALETLFSTDTTELTHKISQRVALFLAASHAEKLDLFAKVKKIYGLRSKVVHGDVIGKTGVEMVTSYADDADSILRKILVKVHSTPSLQKLFQSDKQILDDYFLKTSLGCPVGDNPTGAEED